jgi:AbrB family looped-hinge helix DNA binding protein
MTRMTSKGQVTIPKEIRDKLGIGPGDEVGFREEGGQMILYNDEAESSKAGGRSIAERMAEFGEQMRRAGKMKPLEMSVDEYMDLIRGYSDDVDDPGFKRRS